MSIKKFSKIIITPTSGVGIVVIYLAYQKGRH